jgi:hypothetical protein
MRTWWLAAVIGCSSPGNDVVGPFTGPIHRFAADVVAVPIDSADASAIAGDLDGDGKADNRLGAVATILASTMDLSLDGPDMIASGALASSVELQADDLTDDATVGVRLLGADGAAAVAAGGRLVAGAFHSNRTRETSAPGTATVRLPVYTNADPLIVELDGLELDLDSDGAGGFTGIVRGGIPAGQASTAAFLGLVQMITDEPQRHIPFARLIDMNHDGQITQDEVDASVIGLLVAPDLQLFDHGTFAPHPNSAMKDSLSVAFHVHLVPCASGACASGAPANACRDRLRDGDETDVDCGGSCQPCQAAAACAVAGDCQTGACDVGHCRAPTCSDGLRDGLESDVDCGDSCGVCQLGQACAASADCATGKCNNSVGALGTCVPAA